MGDIGVIISSPGTVLPKNRLELKPPVNGRIEQVLVAEGEKVKAGGILVKVLHTVKIEALPKDLPHSLPVDISLLKEMNNTITVRDIQLPHGVKMLDGLDETIVLIEAPRSEEDLKAAEAAEEAPALDKIEVLSKKPPKEGEVEVVAEGGKKAPEAKK